MSNKAKVNLWKFVLGLCVVAALFVGGLAVTRSPLVSGSKGPDKGLAAKPNTTTTLTAPNAPVLDAVTSVIELDGDITDNPLGVPEDWDTINCDGGTAVVKTGVLADGLNLSIFTGGGSKDPELLADWKHKDGSVPDKDELLNAYAAKYTGATGDEILVFGADRYSNDGTAFMGFWFFVNPVFAAADGKFRQGPLATDPLAVHAIGDVLVLIEFTQGGAIATAKVFEWVGSGGSESGGTLNDITATAPAGSVLSVSNPSPQVLPGTCAAWQHDPKTGPDNTIQTNAFFEGAINLDAFPALQGACFSSFLAETRSSASVTATLKDFVLGQFNTCVEVSLTKTATDVCEGAATTYTYTVKNEGGVAANFILTDDNETGPYTEPFLASQIQADDIDVGADNNCATQVGAGTPTSFNLAAGATRVFQCTIAQTAGTHNNTAQTTGSFGGSSESDVASAQAKVFVNPVAAAGADQSVCATTPHIFNLNASAASVVPAGGTIEWTGTGITFGSPNSLTTTATVGAFGTFTATLTIKSPATQTPGCPDGVDTVQLTLGQNPTAAAGDDQSACDDSPASHQFNLVGTGTVPAGSTVTWSGTGITFGSPNSLTTTATVSAFGTFTATLSIDNTSTGTGCNPASDTVDLTLNENPVITIADVACNAADGGTSILLEAQVTAAGSPGTNAFVWKLNGVVIAGQTTNQLTVTTPGVYTVEVTRSHTDGSVSCTNSKVKNVGLCASDPAP